MAVAVETVDPLATLAPGLESRRVERAGDPSPPHVPRHLLLSVLLI